MVEFDLFCFINIVFPSNYLTIVASVYRSYACIDQKFYVRHTLLLCTTLHTRNIPRQCTLHKIRYENQPAEFTAHSFFLSAGGEHIEQCRYQAGLRTQKELPYLPPLSTPVPLHVNYSKHNRQSIRNYILMP